MRGHLIAFEGGEASGKSTQAVRLAAAIGAVHTREPGGTAVGARIRELFLDPAVAAVDPRAEALLVAADRAQHVAEVIAPALEAGRTVVTDRYVGSSLAYQGYGRGLAVAEVRSLSAWATAGVEADVVILLDVPAEVAEARRNDRPDRMERAGAHFHRAVAEGYRALAAAESERWVVIDGTAPVEVVAAAVLAAVGERLPGAVTA